jgi:hypothetical protein
MIKQRISLSLALLLGAMSCIAQMTDGPYVFYRSGMVIVKSVIERDGKYVALADSFPEAERNKHLLAVHVDGHPEWDFSVALRKTIAVPNCITNDNSQDKIVVLSDIEGEFEHFRKLLLATKVIDSTYQWIFGHGKLIIAGDLFDRGKQVSQFLWLLYKLEDEAAAKGGEVHTILGNHDIMNMSGDFRYVQDVYQIDAALMGNRYSELYGSDTEIGRWLRAKNIIENIGGLLVMHGGVSPQVLALQKTIEAIDSECRPWYDRSRAVPDSLKIFFGPNALFWYRGYFLEPKANEGLVDSTLAFYHARQIIVGHDIIDHVAMLYHGKIVGVDVNEHEDGHEALLIENGKYFRVDEQKILIELHPD